MGLFEHVKSLGRVQTKCQLFAQSSLGKPSSEGYPTRTKEGESAQKCKTIDIWYSHLPHRASQIYSTHPLGAVHQLPHEWQKLWPVKCVWKDWWKLGNHRPGPLWPFKLISLGRVDWCFKVGIGHVISWNICYQTIRSCVSGIHWIQCRGLPWCKVRIPTHPKYLLAGFLAELGKEKVSWGYHTNLPAGSTS